MTIFDFDAVETPRDRISSSSGCLAHQGASTNADIDLLRSPLTLRSHDVESNSYLDLSGSTHTYAFRCVLTT